MRDNAQSAFPDTICFTASSGPNPADVGPKLISNSANFGLNLAGPHPIRAEFARNLVELGLISAEANPNLVDTQPTLAKLGRSGPTSVTFGQEVVKSLLPRPNLVEFGPSSAESGPNLFNSGSDRAELSRRPIWSHLVQIFRTPTRIRSRPSQCWAKLPDSAQNWSNLVMRGRVWSNSVKLRWNAVQRSLMSTRVRPRAVRSWRILDQVEIGDWTDFGRRCPTLAHNSAEVRPICVESELKFAALGRLRSKSDALKAMPMRDIVVDSIQSISAQI